MKLVNQKEEDLFYRFDFTCEEGEHVSVFVEKENRKIHITYGIGESIEVQNHFPKKNIEVANGSLTLLLK